MNKKLFLTVLCVTIIFPVAAVATERITVEKDDVTSMIAFAATVVGVIVSAITVTAYIVKLTNAINNLRTGLIDEVRKNHEEISDLKSISTLNSVNSERRIELLQKDIEANYREISSHQIELNKRLVNLERFESGRHGYQVRDTERPE